MRYNIGRILKFKEIKMNVSKEELLHIAKLSDLNLRENEIDEYLKNLDNMLEYVKVIDNADVESIKETIGANDNINVFRKDEVKTFENMEDLVNGGASVEQNMYKIPKVL
jgi:aspartyl-tRNA(Asn)/glutamyl-tRNA(Gln) amidotransferase subunit C